MARDQGLVINPAKISGVCGRLLCCINYEYQQYEEALRNYPAVNQSIKTAKGDGKVVSISPLNGFLYAEIEGKGLMKLDLEEVKFNRKEAKKLQNELTKEELQHKKQLEKE
jgi:cell fate regulator YaaT (PSP1 superfamily)